MVLTLRVGEGHPAHFSLQLLLVLRVLSVDLRQSTILLQLELLRILSVIDMFNRGPRLVVLHIDQVEAGVLVALSAQMVRLL